MMASETLEGGDQAAAGAKRQASDDGNPAQDVTDGDENTH